MKEEKFNKNITRFLLFLVVILALLAGMYNSLYDLEMKRYKRLEDNYVRVRDSLGVEKTQELIDISRENDNL